MSDQLEMNLTQARELRDVGIRTVAENNAEFLEAARACAKLICEGKGTVTSDDVREGCTKLPLHENAWGAVFKSKEFVFTGKYRQSSLVSRRGGMQRVWRLAPGE